MKENTEGKMEWKWKTKKDIYNKNKKIYYLSIIKKCSGAYGYERITVNLSYTGTSWFPTITSKYLFWQRGKKNKKNKTNYIILQKHFGNDFRKAKKFCEFLVDNFPSYVEKEWKI